MRNETNIPPQIQSIRRFNIKIALWIVILAGVLGANAFALAKTPASNDIGTAIGTAYASLFFTAAAMWSPFFVIGGAMIYGLKQFRRDRRYFNAAVRWLACTTVVMMVGWILVQQIGSYITERNQREYALSQIPYSQETCNKYQKLSESILRRNTYFHVDSDYDYFAGKSSIFDDFLRRTKNLPDTVEAKDVYCTSQQPSQNDLSALESVIRRDEALEKESKELEPVRSLVSDLMYITMHWYDDDIKGKWGNVVSTGDIEVQGYVLTIVCQDKADRGTCAGTTWTNGASTVTTAQLLDIIRGKIGQQDKELETLRLSGT